MSAKTGQNIISRVEGKYRVMTISQITILRLRYMQGTWNTIRHRETSPGQNVSLVKKEQ